jgi:hypothetical protein
MIRNIALCFAYLFLGYILVAYSLYAHSSAIGIAACPRQCMNLFFIYAFGG